MSGNNVFVKDPVYAYVPARVVETTPGDKAIVEIYQYQDERDIQCDGGKKSHRQVQQEINLQEYENGVLPLQNSNANGVLTEVEDMVE